MNRKPKRLTLEETKAETARLLDSGWTPIEIAYKMQVQTATVYNWRNGTHPAPVELKKLKSKEQLRHD